MLSQRQLAANRRNAQRSTGPRTPRGKSVARLNAARHGLYSVTPVIPRFEDPAAWEAHRAETVAGFAPIGRLETTLAERVALILWRLDRIARFEREATALGQDTALADLAPVSHPLHDEPDQPTDIRRDLARARARLRALDRFAASPPDAAVTGAVADHVLRAVADQFPDFDLDDFSAPDLVPDDLPWADLPDWTADRLRRLLHAIADSVGRSPDRLLADAMAGTRAWLAEEQAAARRLARQLAQLRRARILPQPDMLDRVMRYESHLGRQLAQTLAHLRQRQQSRPSPAPPADVPATPPVPRPTTHSDGTNPSSSPPPPSQAVAASRG